MKKRVFDLPTYVEWDIEKHGIEEAKQQLREYDWMYEKHGMEYNNDEWTKEIHVPKFNVGDKVRLVSTDKTSETFGYYEELGMLKVREVSAVCEVKEYGFVLDDDYIYHEDDLELVTDEQLPEYTMEELQNMLGKEFKLIK